MIYLGSDHGGFNLKTYIKSYFEDNDIFFEDLGVYSEESFDYPIIAEKLCKEVLKDKGSKGILVCGTGVGVCIAANKVKGIRAALCSSDYVAKMCRKHNDANVLCLGGRILENQEALSIVKSFLSTDFDGGRHSRRLEQIAKIENEKEK